MATAQTPDINLNEVLRQVAHEKEIDLDHWIAALEDAMASAASGPSHGPPACPAL